MYIVPSMIALGFADGVERWPSKAHKQVAMNLALCNPMVKTRDSLMHVVACVNKIPAERIEKITFAELSEFGLESFVR